MTIYFVYSYSMKRTMSINMLPTTSSALRGISLSWILGLGNDPGMKSLTDLFKRARKQPPTLARQEDIMRALE